MTLYRFEYLHVIYINPIKLISKIFIQFYVINDIQINIKDNLTSFKSNQNKY